MKGKYRKQDVAMMIAIRTLGKAPRRPCVAIFISSSHCRLLIYVLHGRAWSADFEKCLCVAACPQHEALNLKLQTISLINFAVNHLDIVLAV
jgi:hypothetical protein